jgi:hypothetical protein
MKADYEIRFDGIKYSSSALPWMSKDLHRFPLPNMLRQFMCWIMLERITRPRGTETLPSRIVAGVFPFGSSFSCSCTVPQQRPLTPGKVHPAMQVESRFTP